MDLGGPTYTIGRGVDVVFCGDTPTLQCNHIRKIYIDRSSVAVRLCSERLSTGKENPDGHSPGLNWECLHKQKAMLTASSHLVSSSPDPAVLFSRHLGSA